MASQTYYLTTTDGKTVPVAWDGVTPVTWPTGSVISNTLSYDPRPAYNPATQQIVAGPIVRVDASTVSQTWQVVSLTQDQQNDAADKATLYSQAQAAYTALTNHTATAAQTQTILAVVLRYVAKQQGITLT